jgi:signal transduction histidine kinase
MSPHAGPTRFRSSFLFKLFSIFSLLTFLFFCMLCTFYVVTESRQTRNEVIQRLQLRAQNLADSIRLPLYAENLDVLLQMAEKASQAPEILAVMISASDGRMLAVIRTQVPYVTTDAISQTVEVRGSSHYDSVESSLTGGGQDKSSAILGKVQMERGTADITRAVHKVALISILLAAGFWLLVSGISYMLLRRVTDSLITLVQGINVMRDGDFTFRIEINSDDEAGRAAHAVNTLAMALEQRSVENSLLHEESLKLERQMLQSQKLESLGVMAGGIAHDFNNLLQSILGNMELALRNLAPGSDSEMLIANAMKSGKQAAHLTGLILAYTGRGFITRKELKLNDMVTENSDMLRMAATSAVPIELLLSEELPVMMADEASIHQVVMNLIINAAESIENEPGFVRITTGVQNCDQTDLAASLLEGKPKPGRFVFLEVRDNGCGMSEETIKRLFEPFFTTKFTGRGLGMSAVMGIIKMHDGALFLESEEGKGTTFRVLFPISESAGPPETQPQPQPESDFLPPLSGLALVVDDEKSVLKTCTKMVRFCGLKVITACDGIDAVAKFRERADEIDLVLMDVTMPNMGGIEAMVEIYGVRPDTRLILSSGYNKEELIGQIPGQLPSGFMSKPYSMSELEAEIRRVLQGN